MHAPKRADSSAISHDTERAKPLARPVLSPRVVRGRALHMRWRERIATLVGHTVAMKSRLAWASASGESLAHLMACANPTEADRKTLRLVDLLFLGADERAEIMAAIEEWAQAIERGEL